MSFMGNWCFKPEEPIIQCSRQLFGRGPMENCTTNKENFIWKQAPKPKPVKPEKNICTINCPIDGIQFILNIT